MNLAESYLQIADGYRDQGHCIKAGTYYRKALKLDPDNFEAHHGLGCVFFVYSHMAEALRCFKRAHELQPESKPILASMASVIQRSGNYEVALKLFLKALEDRPDVAWVYYDVAACFKALGREEDARLALESACRAEPQNAGYNAGMIWLLDQDSRSTPEAGRIMRREWWEKHHLERQILLQRRPGKIRIGFVSGDFRQHSAVFSWSVPIFGLDREKFEVHCYANSQFEDHWSEKFKAVTSWHRISGLTDVGLAKQVVEDGIDILVDLSGHTGGGRLCAFTQRMAPVQALWGDMNGSQVPEMDYILLAPDLGDQKNYVEKIAPLPCALPYAPPADAPDIGVLPATSNGFITFGYFGRWSKVDDKTAHLWGRIVSQTQARLVVKDRVFEAIPERYRALTRMGLAADQVTFMSLSDFATHLAAHSLADIALDPLAHGGGTTTLEASWMGLPTICNYGDRPIRRISASLMRTLKLTSFAADDYEYTAIRWASPAKRDDLVYVRETLRGRMAQSAICNNALYAAHCNRIFEQMHDRYQARLAA